VVLVEDKETKAPWFLEEAPPHTAVILCRNTKPLVEQAYMMLRHGMGCRIEGRDIGEGLVKLVTRWKRIDDLHQLIDRLSEYGAVEVQKWLAKGKETKAQAVQDQVETAKILADRLIEDQKTKVSDLVSFIRSLFGDSRVGEVPRVVTLSTIHKSKGREWPTVYLLDRAGTLPSKWARKDWQLNQEKNLEYVAITRAQREVVDLVV
jgi:superfamily I DNA/RNA helicase